MNGVSGISSSSGDARLRGAVVRAARRAVLASLALLQTGCAIYHHYDAVSGRVVDADTGAPLEGAVVVAVYNAEMASVGGPVTHYVDAQETKTDAKGEFTVPAKSIFEPQFGLGNFKKGPALYAAKPEYGSWSAYPVHRDNDPPVQNLSLGHPRAKVKWEAAGRLEIGLPHLLDEDERRQFASWEPTIPEPEKIPYFFELQNKEGAHFGFPPEGPWRRQP